jgi:hypothetical protein
MATPPYPATVEWMDGLIAHARDDDAHPALAAAIRDEKGLWDGADSLIRLLGCGWSRTQIDAAVARARANTTLGGRDGEPVAYGDALSGIAQLAHLGPTVFDAWSQHYHHDIKRMSQYGERMDIEAWQAAAPGFGPACRQAGLGYAEAAALYHDGHLTTQSLAALTALRTGSH